MLLQKKDDGNKKASNEAGCEDDAVMQVHRPSNDETEQLAARWFSAQFLSAVLDEADRVVAVVGDVPPHQLCYQN